MGKDKHTLYTLTVQVSKVCVTILCCREMANENTPLDLLFDPEPVKDHFTLMDGENFHLFNP